MYRFTGFTQKANDALNSAITSAENLGHTYVGSEHILLGLLAAAEELSDGLGGTSSFVENLIGGGGDGHIHTALLRQFPSALCSIVAFHNSTDFLHSILYRLSLADEDTRSAITGVHGSASNDQIAHTRKARKGVLAGSHGYAQPGHFRQATGHQHRFGVVTAA